MSESTIFEGSRKAVGTKKADAGHVRGAARYRLTPQLIAAWHQRIGASEIDGKNLPRPACSADSGASDFISAMSVEPLHGSELQQHIFWRTLGVTSVFALLRTPCTTARTVELIKQILEEEGEAPAETAAAQATAPSTTKTKIAEVR